MEEISNEILIKCRKNDIAAYRLVVRHYSNFVFSVVYRFLGGKYAEELEDFAREIFVRLFFLTKKYDTGKSGKFSTVVFSAVRNYCFNELRIKRLRPEPAEKNNFPAVEDPESEFLTGELEQRVEKCIEILPDDQRLILILREYEKFSNEETAGLMELPPGIVKTKLNRAKIKLKELLWPYLKEDHGKSM